MRRVVVLLVGLAVIGAATEILFEPAPTLFGVFQLVVRGVDAENGKAVLVNLATGELKPVELSCAGSGLLKSGPILVRRQCDLLPEREGLEEIIVSGVGDTLVAATELGCGLSVAHKVGPRAGPIKMRLEKLVDEKWQEVQTLRAGTYRLVVIAPEHDRTCELDPLPDGLKISSETESLVVDIKESAPASGEFSFEFRGEFQLDREKGELWYRISWDGGEFRVSAPCAPVVFYAAGQEIRVEVETIAVEASSGPILIVPVGCQAQVCVVKPAEPDEVWWQLSGYGWHKGNCFEVGANVPTFPEALLLRVLARQGADWGMTQIALTVVDRPRLSFVTQDGKEVSRPWPATEQLRVRVEGILGFFADSVVVRVGKLGPHPMTREIRLSSTPQGYYESAALAPSDWNASSGDILWAELCYPEPMGCCFSVILPLR